MTNINIDKRTLYLVYDDECPLCRHSAHALRIKQAVGNLVLINAREENPIVSHLYERGFDLDQGIIVIYNDQYYYGSDAVHFLAMLNTPSNILNKMAAKLLSSRLFTRLCYPVLKSIRRLLLHIKGVSPVKFNNGQPLFAEVLGDDWQKLSPMMKRRFGNRPYSNYSVSVQGAMTIKSSRWMRFISPFLKLAGGWLDQDGENIPVTVKFTSEPNTAKYWFDREFAFTSPMHLKTYMVHIKNNIMVEFFRFNLGWRTKFSVSGDRVIMSHDGYVLRVLNFLIPLPVALFVGKVTVIEYPVSENAFAMEATINHFFLGKIYEYRGVFSIISN